MTPDQREALAYLLYGIQQRKGLLVLSGEVGVGKTLIVRALLEQLDESVETAMVMTAKLTFKQLLHMALCDLGLNPGRDKVSMLLILQQYLLQLHHVGRTALLVVDEAQNLSDATLEEFRLLSNLETRSQKLLQILLVGQPELKTSLNSHGLRQLRQRIPGMWELSPLAREGVGDYVEHRLRIASENGSERIFDDGAIEEIARYSRGVPRSINVLCDRALIIGYVYDRKHIDAKIVREAVEELEKGFRPRRRKSYEASVGVEG
jgi:general secretion pathway protein A